MILPLDKTRRDSELFQYSPKPLRAYIAPNHILLKIVVGQEPRAPDTVDLPGVHDA